MGVEEQLIAELATIQAALARMRPLCRWEYNETECDHVSKAHRVTFRSFQLRERDIRHSLGIEHSEREHRLQRLR